ncbi:MAG: tRNA dihydrouridine synthase DusB [Gammaproteobacteria bacterium]|nr:tRNA dihydrouridine synthase DusB [Gammaproteobacteria bacterium]
MFLAVQIGPYQLENQLILAPMAGVTDRPFRQLCRQFGAAMTVSEMISSRPELRQTRKTRLRMQHDGENQPRSIQIAGTDPLMMAEAARFNVQQGAQIIDINMGCPAKKVCSVLAGSALMKNESLVADILHSVVSAVDVPVTLKMRTGWDSNNRNVLSIAKIAESAGIQALAIHGRTRADKYNGDAEYEHIALVKDQVSIPVIANGDIDTPEKAAFVLKHTHADGLMIGRAAQGNPWIFQEINYFLRHGKRMDAPDKNHVRDVMLKHLMNLYDFYGEYMGLRIARKHLGWYCKTRPNGEAFRRFFNTLETTDLQQEQIRLYFEDEHRAMKAA